MSIGGMSRARSTTGLFRASGSGLPALAEAASLPSFAQVSGFGAPSARTVGMSAGWTWSVFLSRDSSWSAVGGSMGTWRTFTPSTTTIWGLCASSVWSFAGTLVVPVSASAPRSRLLSWSGALGSSAVEPSPVLESVPESVPGLVLESFPLVPVFLSASSHAFPSPSDLAPSSPVLALSPVLWSPVLWSPPVLASWSFGAGGSDGFGSAGFGSVSLGVDGWAGVVSGSLGVEGCAGVGSGFLGVASARGLSYLSLRVPGRSFGSSVVPPPPVFDVSPSLPSARFSSVASRVLTSLTIWSAESATWTGRCVLLAASPARLNAALTWSSTVRNSEDACLTSVSRSRTNWGSMPSNLPMGHSRDVSPFRDSP
ncbi:hypothetical protein DMB42_06605 [Nonomuraea sp. WAC 01424]|nr:hypothetical protein DMB42_06605 [Nonomuraea sp. WAC 01424]